MTKTILSARWSLSTSTPKSVRESQLKNSTWKSISLPRSHESIQRMVQWHYRQNRVQEGCAPSPKLFTAPLKNAMCPLKGEDMWVKVVNQQFQHLCSSKDIAFISPSISQAHRTLADFDRLCGNAGLQLNLTKS